MVARVRATKGAGVKVLVATQEGEQLDMLMTPRDSRNVQPDALPKKRAAKPQPAAKASSGVDRLIERLLPKKSVGRPRRVGSALDQIPISADIKHQIKIQAAIERRQMNEIVEEAWGLYIKKHGVKIGA